MAVLCHVLEELPVHNYIKHKVETVHVNVDTRNFIGNLIKIMECSDWLI